MLLAFFDAQTLFSMSYSPQTEVHLFLLIAPRDIEIGVDNDGFIFLSFEAPETHSQPQFDWKKNYRQAIDAGRAHLETKENKCVYYIF